MQNRLAFLTSHILTFQKPVLLFLCYLQGVVLRFYQISEILPTEEVHIYQLHLQVFILKVVRGFKITERKKQEPLVSEVLYL